MRSSANNEKMRKHCQLCWRLCRCSWLQSSSQQSCRFVDQSICVCLKNEGRMWSNDRNDRIRCREQTPNCQTPWQFMFLFMPICHTYLQNAFHFPSPNHKSLTRFIPPRNIKLCILGTSGRSSAPFHQQRWKQMWRNHIYWHLLNFRIHWVQTASKNGKTPFTKNNLALRMFLSGLLAPNASRNGAWPWQVQLSNWVTDISRHPRICWFGAWQKHKSSCIKFRGDLAGFWVKKHEKRKFPTQK